MNTPPQITAFAASSGFPSLRRNAEISWVNKKLGTANLTGNWNVEFTKISEGTLVGAQTKGIPSYDATSATFEVDLAYPGASATYNIEVSNNGNIDAVLDSITGVDTANNTEPTEIKYTVTGVNVGDSLLASNKAVVTVKVEWVATTEEGKTDVIPEKTTKTATITLNYVQKTTSGSAS